MASHADEQSILAAAAAMGVSPAVAVAAAAAAAAAAAGVAASNAERDAAVAALLKTANETSTLRIDRADQLDLSNCTMADKLVICQAVASHKAGQRDWCREHNVPHGTIGKWMIKYKELLTTGKNRFYDVGRPRLIDSVGIEEVKMAIKNRIATLSDRKDIDRIITEEIVNSKLRRGFDCESYNPSKGTVKRIRAELGRVSAEVEGLQLPPSMGGPPVGGNGAPSSSSGVGMNTGGYGGGAPMGFDPSLAHHHVLTQGLAVTSSIPPRERHHSHGGPGSAGVVINGSAPMGMAPQGMQTLGDGMSMAAAVQMQQQQQMQQHHHAQQMQQQQQHQQQVAMQQQQQQMVGVPGAPYGNAAVATAPIPLPSLQMVQQTSTQALV